MLKKLNFKVIFCLFLFVLPLTPFVIHIQAEDDCTDNVSKPSELSFAVWNIQRLGGLNTLPHKPQNRSAEELKAIAQILYRYDFITIIELYDEKYLKDIKGHLKEVSKEAGIEKVYESHVSPMAGKDEMYAFLYNCSFIEILPNDRGFYPHKKEIFLQSRKPYWATFKANEFDFSVIAVHFASGDKEKKRKQVKELRKIYQHVQGENNGENDVLLVGDFNLDPCDVDAFWNLMTLGKMTALFHRKEHRSSLTKVKEKRLHDNIIFDRKYLTEQEYRDNNCDVYKFDKDPLYKNFNPKRISDHQVFEANFTIDRDDDADHHRDHGTYDNKAPEPREYKPGTQIAYYAEGKEVYHSNTCGHLRGDKFKISLDEVTDCYKPCSRFENEEQNGSQ